MRPDAAEERELRDLVMHATTVHARLDGAGLTRRLADRRRRRRVGAGAVLAAVAFVGVIGVGAVVAGLSGEQVELAEEESRAGRESSVAAGASAAVLGDLQPTALPDGTVRCDGPDQSGEVTTTTFCGPSGEAILESGPHHALPEVGDPVPVAARVGYVQRFADRTSVTVSDGNTLDDRHLRYTVTDPHADVAHLVEVLASIPAIADAPPSPVPE